MAHKAIKPYPWQRVPRLAMRIRYGQAKHAHNELDILLDEFDVEHDRRLGPRRLRCAMVMSYCVRGARLGGGISDQIIDQVLVSLDKLEACRSWRAIRRFMHDYVDLMMAYVQPRNQSRMVRLIARIQRELRETPGRAQRLADYAASAQLHPDYLSRTFKQTTGQTFADARRDGRITRARHLLASSNAKVQAIARRVGMNDTSQFIKDFKLETGQTPQAFRRSCHHR